MGHENEPHGCASAEGCCSHDNDRHTHDAHHHDHHHDNGNSNSEQDDALCLAVVREDGADVVVFDASGTPQTYHFDGKDIRQLCFQTHGRTLDDLLTPCFDQDGNHGTPDEDCFCGVDTPHLHAHLYDPQLCGGAETDSVTTKTTDSCTDNVQRLASQTLFPRTMEESQNPLKIGISENMPNECNSALLLETDDETGRICSSTKDKPTKNNDDSFYRRLQHPVQHENHVDFLVHNRKTGDLHLEHPNCNGCGKADIHGSFQPVGKRQFATTVPSKGSSITKQVQVHFFHVATRPFNLLEHLKTHGLPFEPQRADRVVAATRPLLSTSSPHAKSKSKKKQKCCDSGCCSNKQVSPQLSSPKKSMESVSSTPLQGRSQFFVTNICCASEIPVILKIVEPLAGVGTVSVNATTKQVYVQHQLDQISAHDIKQALDQAGMHAKIRVNARDRLQNSTASTANQQGRSQFFVTNICCASEIPVVLKIVEPLAGVGTVSVNATTKQVYVQHQLDQISAHDIKQALDQAGMHAEIRVNAKDRMQSNNSNASLFVQSTLTWDDTDEEQVSDEKVLSTESLAAILQGLGDSHQMERFVVHIPSKSIQIVHNPFLLTAARISELLENETGLHTTVSVDGSDPNLWDFWGKRQGDNSSGDGMTEKGVDEEGVRYPKPTVILSGIFWVLSMLNLVGGNWEYLKYVGLLSVVFGLPPIAIKAFRTLQRFQFDTNCLMLFASVGAVALQEYAEAAAVVFLFAISEYLEVRATSRARQALSELVNLRPDKANLVHPSTREVVRIPAEAVPVGAIVSVKTGDKIPCDGIVVEGRSTVDESSLTGESRPISKGPDANVSGGTINSGLSPLTIRATATCENSAVSRLIRLVEEAQLNRSETEMMVDEFARWYTPVIVLAAVLMCSIPWAFGTDVGKEWTANGLILIVVACPCALIISTPVSYVAGLAATARKGVLIKGGATLEALAVVKNICFDKTGTLTNGEFAILHLESFSGSLSRQQVIQHLVLMEESASHPVAQAILNAAKNENVRTPRNLVLEKHKIVAGEGVEGVVNGDLVHVGNERLFERLNLLKGLDKSVLDSVEEWKGIGGTVGFMSIEGHGIVCAYCAADGVRAESSSVVGRLQKRGIHVTMLTGDNHDAAQAVGRQIGLPTENIKSKLLPEEKLGFIEDLSSASHTKSALTNLCGSKEITLMCGDGVNDAPALATANIGVAMGAGAALAMETADVTLLDSNLEKLEYCIGMGERVTRKIKENVLFSVSVKFVVLGFALAGMAHLWAAIASDVGAMILVTLNSMMLLPRRQKKVTSDQSSVCDEEDGTKAGLSTRQISSSATGDAENGASSPHGKLGLSSCKKACSPSKTQDLSTSCEKSCCGSSEGKGPASAQETRRCASKEREALSSAPKACCSSKTQTLNTSCKTGCCHSNEEVTFEKGC